MKKLLFAICLISISSLGQDYKLSSYKLKLTKATPEAIKEINSVIDIDRRTVELDKTFSQVDFDIICSEMPWIKDLKLPYNSKEINNIDSIGKLSNLERLSIRKLAIAKTEPLNIEGLGTCKKLKFLELEGTPVSSTNPLKDLSDLEELDLSDCHLTTLDFLEGKKALKVFLIRGFQHTFEDYKYLEGLSTLEELNLYANKQATQENLQVLKKLTSLKKFLMIDNDNIKSLDFLEGLENLEHVDIKWSKSLTDISGLTLSQKLRKINLSKCPVADLSALANKNELYYLDISETEVTDFSVIKGMNKMKEIYLQKTPFSDLSLLENATNLRTIYLDETKVTSLASLQKNPKLSTLSIPHTAITEIAPVLEAKNLYSLTVGPDFPENQIALSKNTIPKLRLRVTK